jgi:hypothetical protein
MYDDETPEREPVRDALAALRELDPEWRAGLPDEEADAEVARRMRDLRLAVAATHELIDQGEEEPTPAQVRDETDRLYDEFMFDPAHLLVLAEGARDDGDHDDANLLEAAYHWHLALARRAPLP